MASPQTQDAGPETGPDGGLALSALGPADKPIHKLCIRNPVWEQTRLSRTICSAFQSLNQDV